MAILWLASSGLRPDLVVYSELTKISIIIELTVCFEPNFKEAKERSRNTVNLWRRSKVMTLLWTCSRLSGLEGVHKLHLYEGF